jgi:hypothetical protein
LSRADPAPTVHYAPAENLEHIDVELIDSARRKSISPLMCSPIGRSCMHSTGAAKCQNGVVGSTTTSAGQLGALVS